MGRDSAQGSLVGLPLQSDPGSLGFNSWPPPGVFSGFFLNFGEYVWGMFGITLGSLGGSWGIGGEGTGGGGYWSLDTRAGQAGQATG
jgi:hypothetical protein